MKAWQANQNGQMLIEALIAMALVGFGIIALISSVGSLLTGVFVSIFRR